MSGFSDSYQLKALVAVVVFLFLSTCVSFAQTTQQDLRIAVVDAFDSAPLSGAVVLLTQDGQVLGIRTTGVDGFAVFNVTITGVETLPATNFRLAAPYPSPAQALSTLPIDLDKSGTLTVHLFDALGRKVASRSTILPPGSHGIELDLSGLARGTYFASVEFNGQTRIARPVVLTSTSGGSPAISFSASGVAIPKTVVGKTGRGPSDLELLITRDGYVDGTYEVDVSQSDDFTAWMNIKPETVAVKGIVVAGTANDAVPLIAAYEDSTTFHILGNTNAPLPDQVIVTSHTRQHMSITLRSDGLPERVVVGSSIALFGNYRNSLVDIAIISPDGSTEFATGVDISQVLPLGKGNATEAAPGWGLSETMRAVGLATSVASCGINIAGTAFTSGAMEPFAFILCGALALQATAVLLPSDNPALEITATGLGAFGVTIGCVDISNTIANQSWIDCAVEAASFAEAISLSSNDAESAQQEAVNDAKTTLGINVFEATRNSIGMELVRIPAGTFQMGSSIIGSSDERPVHTITLTRDFWIGKFEVTQGEYLAVTGSSPSFFTGHDRLPVEKVSWFDAINFANLLSTSEGLLPCYGSGGNVIGGEIISIGGDVYTCSGYRLPTEAEWEYMARAGTTTEYSFGDDEGQLGTYAWFDTNSGSRTHSVGEKLPNAWGIFDVHGNVWELAHDGYSSSYYSSTPASNPPGFTLTSNKVDRGGSWEFRAVHLRSPNRGFNSVANPFSSVGFRLARTAQ